MDLLIKKVESGSVKYALLTTSVFTFWLIGIALMNSIMLEQSFLGHLPMIGILSLVLAILFVWVLSKINNMNNPITIKKSIITRFLIIDVISFITSLYVCYGANKEVLNERAVEQIKIQEQQKKIRERQEEYEKLSPEEKAKIELERIENEKINKMSSEEKDNYLKEKKLFSTMTTEQVEIYKKEKQLKQEQEELEEKKNQEKVKLATIFVALIKSSMRAPDTFELKNVNMKSNGYYCITYQARNIYNVHLRASSIFSESGVVLSEEHDGNKFIKSWNKNCTKPGKDITKAVIIAEIKNN